MKKRQLRKLIAKMMAEKSSTDKVSELYKAYNAYLKEKSLDDFDEKLAADKIDQFDLHQVFYKSPSKARRIWKWTIGTAAAMLMIFGLYYFSFDHSNQLDVGDISASSTNEAEIPKISIEAIAVLPNGEEILLNSEGFNVVENPKVMAGADLAEQFITLKTNRGGQLNFKLPDGSLVWLNSETTLIYPVAFGKSSRKVELYGEAYFEVNKEKVNDMPVSFIVDAGSQQINVLGTKFNVSNYQSEEIKTTTLVEGSVEVIGNMKSVRLTPNQQFVQGHDFSKVVQVNAQDYVGWKDGVLQLNRQDFPALARIIERNYNVKFDEKVLPKGFELNGELMTDVNIDELLRGLGAAMGVKFVRHGSIIRIEK